jgi:hypothetical protein
VLPFFNSALVEDEMRLWICLAMLGLLALSGCPKPGADETNVEVTSDSGTPEAAAVDSTSQAAAEAPADETAGEPAVPNGEATGELARKPSRKDLTGKWFALYGGVGMGATTYTYENGHHVEFLDNGMAIWELSGQGGSQNQVVSNWDLTSGEIKLTVDKPGALSGGVGNTPLAFGRDDEVGLTDSQNEQQPAIFRYTPELDGSFLALKGRQGELMIYGRAESQNATAAPDVSGDWTLVSAPGQQDDVKVTVTDNQMETSWGPHRNTFKGMFTNGYFVGTVTSTAGMAIAAVTPRPDGTLDGVISTEPYSKWQSTFDFTRAAK